MGRLAWIHRFFPHYSHSGRARLKEKAMIRLKPGRQQIANALLFRLADGTTKPEFEPLAVPGSEDGDGGSQLQILHEQLPQGRAVDLRELSLDIETAGAKVDDKIGVAPHRDHVQRHQDNCGGE
jgi:hypothetical protein